jgi:hypothetical protein
MKRIFVLLIILLLTASTMLTVNSISVIENTWVTKANMPQAIVGCKAAVCDGKIFVIGNSAN